MKNLSIEEIVSLINIRASNYVNNKSNTADNSHRLNALNEAATDLLLEIERIKNTRSINENHIHISVTK